MKISCPIEPLAIPIGDDAGRRRRRVANLRIPLLRGRCVVPGCRAEPITKSDAVKSVIEKFRQKYGGREEVLFEIRRSGRDHAELIFESRFGRRESARRMPALGNKFARKRIYSVQVLRLP